MLENSALDALSLPMTLPPVGLTATASLAPLSPDSLTPEALAVWTELLRSGESENTHRSYRAALMYWAGWFQLRYGRPIALPVPVAAVRQFVLDHALRPTAKGETVCELPPAFARALVEAGLRSSAEPFALATLEHRLHVISKVHRVRELASPCHSAEVRQALSRVRAAYAARGVLATSKPALTREPLEQLLQTCDESAQGLRDKALLLFAWSSGGRRRSEVASARLENLTRISGDAYLYNLAVSKTNRDGRDHENNIKPVVGRAAQALAAWLHAAGIHEGFLFRRVRRGGHIGTEGLKASAVREIVVRRAALAGLPDHFSAHSLRSGFVTEAAHQQASLPEAMALSGHKSVAVFRRYYRNDPLRNAAGRLLEVATKEEDLS